MIIDEVLSPRMDYSQAVVRITKHTTLAESLVRYNKITVVARPGSKIIDTSSGGLTIVGTSIPEDLKDYLVEEELNEVRNFYGTIKLHNDLSNLDDIYNEAYMWGVTLIFTSGASRYIMEEHLSIPNQQLYCWLTYTQNELDSYVLDLATRTNVGVMLNQNKDERVLFTLSSMLQFAGRIVPTNAIINDNFAGIAYLDQADYLAERGISFWLKTRQKSYPFALFLGKEQAYTRYYDAIIEHEVREAIASFIHQGASMGQLELLGNTISMALARFTSQMQDNITIDVPQLSSISASNRKAGIVDLVTISYSLFGEVRTVHINI